MRGKLSTKKSSIFAEFTRQREETGRARGRDAFSGKAYIYFRDTLALYKSVAARKSAKYAD